MESRKKPRKTLMKNGFGKLFQSMRLICEKFHEPYYISSYHVSFNCSILIKDFAGWCVFFCLFVCCCCCPGTVSLMNRNFQYGMVGHAGNQYADTDQNVGYIYGEQNQIYPTNNECISCNIYAKIYIRCKRYLQQQFVKCSCHSQFSDKLNNFPPDDTPYRIRNILGVCWLYSLRVRTTWGFLWTEFSSSIKASAFNSH